MNSQLQTQLENLFSSDGDVRNEAFRTIIEATDEPVDWAYDVWDELLANLDHKNNHFRAIAPQVLCNLAKSDPDKRILTDFDAILAVTRDKRFVTARHALQALWKIGAAGEEQKQRLLAGLTLRYEECITEKNCTLIRYDIIDDLRKLYDQTPDDEIKQKALALIETEEDLKYRKKYAKRWKGV